VTSEYAKVSVTLPAALLDRVKAKVGVRGVSSYVARALEAEERQEALRAWLADQDAKHGPVPKEVMDDVRHQWLGDASLAG